MTQQANPPQDPFALISGAQDMGLLSLASASMLNVPNIGAQIGAALGTPSLQVASSEVLIVSELIDDSGSIRFRGNAQTVRDGHNLVIESLGGSKQSAGIQIHCRYLNGTILFDYRPLAGAIKMDTKNYDPVGGTPLYDQSVILLGTVIAKVSQFMNDGVPARSITLIATDGHDEGSVDHDESHVATLVTDLLAQSEQHIVAGMGIDDGRTDFYKVFSGRTKQEVEDARAAGTLDDLLPNGGMGLLPKWVLTPGNSPSEVRKAFQVFSQSAVRVSQSAAAFSQAAAGGFGA